MRLLRYVEYGVLILMIFALFAAHASAYDDDAGPVKDVVRSGNDILVIDSYDICDGWSSNIYKGISDELINDGYRNPRVEYLNAGKFPEKEHLDVLYNLIKTKHKKEDYRVIVAIGKAAVSFVVEHYDELFSGLPVVVCGTEGVPNVPDSLKDYITGIYSENTLLENAEYILRASPEPVQTYYLILDAYTDSDLGTRELVDNFREFCSSNSVTGEVFSDRSLDEICYMVSSLGTDSAVIIGRLSKDPAGRHYDGYTALKKISESSSAPVFTVGRIFGDDMSGSLVGGFTKDPYSHGVLAGNIIKRILKGESPAHISLNPDTSVTPVFNLQALAKYRYDAGSLPEDAIYLNGADTGVKISDTVYILIVTGVIIALVSLSCLIVKMCVSRRKLNLIRYNREVVDAVAEGLKLGIFEIRIRDNYCYFSPQIAYILGYSPEKLERTELPEILKLIHPDDLNGILIEGLKGILKDEGVTRVECTVRIKSLSQEWKNISLSLDCDVRGGRIIRCVGTMEDITERVQAHDDLDTAVKRLYVIAAVTRHFISMKIDSLQVYLQVFNSIPGSNSEKDTVFDSVLRSIVLIKRQIEFTTEYYSNSSQETIWISLREYIREAYESILMQSGIVVRYECRDVELYVGRLFVWVMCVIFDNSRKFVGSNAKITVDFEEMENGAGRIIVCDNGAGIPYELKEKIFDKSYIGEYSGSLYLCRNVLETSGCSIEENGTPGEGVRFVITIPVGRWRKIRDIYAL